MDVGLRKAPCVSCYYPLSVFLAQTSLLSVVSQFIQDAQLTQREREHTVSWNRVKCCTGVRRIAFEKGSNLWMTFKVIQGHCLCCHLIGHIRFPISLPLYRFRDINTYLPKIKTSRDLDHAHLGTVCNHKKNTSRANSCIKFYDSIFSHSREI